MAIYTSNSVGSGSCSVVKMLPKILLVFLAVVAPAVMVGTPRRPIDVPFQKNYVPSWAADHIKYIDGGKKVTLSLDNSTGTGFQSKDKYLFGNFSMHIKMIPGDSAGTVTAFYLSSQNLESMNSKHDEIDFEFLGNREKHIYLWFDPTKDFHSYSVLWNVQQTVFFVDDIPIRVFKNSKFWGVRYPFNQPMKIYSSQWNADD